MSLIKILDACLYAANNNLISFVKHAINQYNINCCPKAFNNLNLQHSTLVHKISLQSDHSNFSTVKPFYITGNKVKRNQTCTSFLQVRFSTIVFSVNLANTNNKSGIPSPLEYSETKLSGHSRKITTEITFTAETIKTR